MYIYIYILYITYGNYKWTETFGGKTVITKCAFKQDSNITRKCLPYGDGWGDIGFTACRSSQVSYRFYLAILSGYCVL